MITSPKVHRNSFSIHEKRKMWTSARDTRITGHSEYQYFPSRIALRRQIQRQPTQWLEDVMDRCVRIWQRWTMSWSTASIASDWHTLRQRNSREITHGDFWLGFRFDINPSFYCAFLYWKCSKMVGRRPRLGPSRGSLRHFPKPLFGQGMRTAKYRGKEKKARDRGKEEVEIATFASLALDKWTS